MCDIIEYPFPNTPNKNIGLFPEELIKGKVLFHGTSKLYSDKIDKEGFSGDSLIISRRQMELFLELLNNLNMPDGNMFNQTPKIRIKAYLNNDYTSFSLAFNPYEALFYAIGRTKGGQILMAFEDAINWINVNGFDLDSKQNEIVKLISDKIIGIQQSQGCIYLLDFNDNSLEKNIYKSRAANNILTDGFDIAVFKGKGIPCDIIKAKMYVPINFDIDENILKSMINISNNAIRTPETYQFYLNQRELASKRSEFS